MRTTDMSSICPLWDKKMYSEEWQEEILDPRDCINCLLLIIRLQYAKYKKDMESMLKKGLQFSNKKEIKILIKFLAEQLCSFIYDSMYGSESLEVFYKAIKHEIESGDYP